MKLQWNIERGYKLEEIVRELRGINADVIALQEVDIGCERSSSIDTGVCMKYAAYRLSCNPADPLHIYLICST